MLVPTHTVASGACLTGDQLPWLSVVMFAAKGRSLAIMFRMRIIARVAFSIRICNQSALSCPKAACSDSECVPAVLRPVKWRKPPDFKHTFRPWALATHGFQSPQSLQSQLWHHAAIGPLELWRAPAVQR